MRFTGYSFGSVRVDGVTYDHDLIIDRGKVRKRKKAASRKFRGAYGHTPLSIAENIPWRCRRLVVGSGADGALPVMQQVRDEARRRKIDLVVLPTAEAISALTKATADTNAILPVRPRPSDDRGRSLVMPAAAAARDSPGTPGLGRPWAGGPAPGPRAGLASLYGPS